ncbi:hypothetical protein [Streptomyces sp. NPDC048295]|uniref:hypothetical protein n=1 Tax=Streptomyces sp. NPDC048295 TaxID=3154617 RepID=UPI003443FB77
MKSVAPVGIGRGARSLGAATAAATPRLLMGVVPLVTLGVFGFVPSAVMALRRRRTADWSASAAFAALSAAWVLRIVLTPDETHGFGFAVDFLLLVASTLGATAHALFAWRAGAGAGVRAERPVREVR